MLTWHLVMKVLLGASIGVLLAVNGVWLDHPAFWITMIGLAVAGLLGYDEGRRDAPEQQGGPSVDNSENH
jgi:hypothetical protein